MRSYASNVLYLDTTGQLHLYLFILRNSVPVIAVESLALLIHIQEVLDSI
jgi:hypothetical protein